MSKQLPERPSLEHLKNEAKALKKSRSLARLTDAQREVAREYGFPSWIKLKRTVEGFDNLRHIFFDAIRAGDRDQVKGLADPVRSLSRSRDDRHFGQTPISAAAERNDLPMIDLLVRLGADVNARSDWWAGSFGPLDFCDPKTADHLLKKGASLTAHAAARLGKTQELRQIIESDPEAVHARGGDGQFPLHFASTPEVVDILVEAGAELDARDLDHESTAAQWRIKNKPVLERLVHHGAKTDIFMAVVLDDPELVKKHLDDDPGALTRASNEPGNPLIHDKAPGAPIYVYEIASARPLQLAAYFGCDKAFDTLFERSPATGRLLAAVYKGDRELALKYQAEVANLSSAEASQVSMAACHCRLDILALMLDLGFSPNVQDHEGMSPLMWSAFHGWGEGVELILRHEPDLTLKNVYGGTALGTLGYGSLNGWHKDGEFARCAEMLIEAGAEVMASMNGNEAVNAVLDRHR